MTLANKNIHKRRFKGEDFYANLELGFQTKEEARIYLQYLKKKNKNVKGRVLEKRLSKDNGSTKFFIYFDEISFKNIENGTLELPDISEIGELVKENKDVVSTNRERNLKKKKPISSENKSRKTKKLKKTRPKNESKTKTKDSNSAFVYQEPDRYYDTINDVPAYLLGRMSKEAQDVVKMGILKIQNLPKKKLEKYIELLRAQQVNYDIRIKKEKEIIGFMEDLAKAMDERLHQIYEQEANDFIQKNIIEPLNNGKFDKKISKIKKLGIDEVSYLIFKSLKGSIKKYPFSETNLIKKIKVILENRQNKL
ncbi:MAG: hypothetical protein ACTSRZ_06730 [Promethearchaeota archaeon]